MVIFGGGYIVVELGYVFFVFGIEVMVINCGDWLLKYEDDDVF